MLETRNLCKTYKPKKGVSVQALKDINLKFPRTGMVFLLGKSGSGKSTLLNLLGGLDQYDSGDILIKGVSTSQFKQQHFDSYRNTYVGFIFQEYNVLEEFSVGANVALAIELQNRKATDQEITDILREVDLEGFGERRPNELSGGQKQRVAIARALVKNPEIIMADEPTGALDSNTGRQVFDTLKKLSQKKLVIIVSHDREFAEQYADRIITLSDGDVVSDVEYVGEACENKPNNLEENQTLTYEGSTIQVAAGYHLSEADRKAINDYIDAQGESGVQLRLGAVENQKNLNFSPTDTSKIPQEDGTGFNLIKSKLPMKNAFKIGASGLKYKKFRLVMTVLLSCVAFGLFGLADTFGSYDHVKTCTKSIMDSEINYASVVKAQKEGSGVNSYWNSYGYHLSSEDIQQMSENTGVNFDGVFAPMDSIIDFSGQINPEVPLTDSEYNVYATSFTGFAQLTQSTLDSMGYELVAGTLPADRSNEIAISKFLCETFKKAGYLNVAQLDIGETPTYDTISTYADMVGRTLRLNGTDYVISGVIDTNLDLDRYASLTEKVENQSTADALIDYAMYNELQYANGYSLNCAAMVGTGVIQQLVEQSPTVESINGYLYFSANTADEANWIDVSPDYIGTLDDVNADNIIWIDGEKSELGDKELIVSLDMIEQSWQENYKGNDLEAFHSVAPTAEDIQELLADYSTFTLNSFSYTDNTSDSVEGYTIVGVIDNWTDTYAVSSGTILTNAALHEQYTNGEDGIYSYAVGAMPTEKSAISKLVSYCYREDTTTRYQLQNSVTYELDTVNSVLKALSKVFLYIGIGFAVFAAIMLANFIGTSISYKKQEIGILRAIGSRSSDVFRIFFSESFVIAMVNFVLSSIGVAVATNIINHVIRNEGGILITVLSFGIRQIVLLFVVSMAVAAVASFLPVKKIASKRPIDAIRNR